MESCEKLARAFQEQIASLLFVSCALNGFDFFVARECRFSNPVAVSVSLSLFHLFATLLSGLEQFYPRFKAKGVNEHNFCNLQPTDFPELGVQGVQERQKLGKLIAIIKRELEQGAKKQTDAAAPRGISSAASSVPASSVAPSPPPPPLALGPLHIPPSPSAPPAPASSRRPAASPSVPALVPAPVSSAFSSLAGLAFSPSAPDLGVRGVGASPSLAAASPSAFPAPSSAGDAGDDDDGDDDDTADDLSSAPLAAGRPGPRPAPLNLPSTAGSPGTGPGAAAAAAAASVAKRSRISVVVRKRPINRKERGRGEADIVTVLDKACTVLVHEPK